MYEPVYAQNITVRIQKKLETSAASAEGSGRVGGKGIMLGRLNYLKKYFKYLLNLNLGDVLLKI